MRIINEHLSLITQIILYGVLMLHFTFEDVLKILNNFSKGAGDY